MREVPQIFDDSIFARRGVLFGQSKSSLFIITQSLSILILSNLTKDIYYYYYYYYYLQNVGKVWRSNRIVSDILVFLLFLMILGV